MADYTRFQLRGDTRANWLSVNPILAKNEPAIETDTKRFKIGDGVSTYSQLSYGRNTSEYASLYNVTSLFPLPSGYYSHESAVLAIPVGERIKGLIITYETASGVWYTERFIGTNVSGWTTLSNWEKVPDASDVAQLRSDLSKKTVDITPITLTPNYAISSTTGIQLVLDGCSACLDYLIYEDVYRENRVMSKTPEWYILYDASKVYLGRSNDLSSVPAGTVFFRFYFKLVLEDVYYSEFQRKEEAATEKATLKAEIETNLSKKTVDITPIILSQGYGINSITGKSFEDAAYSACLDYLIYEDVYRENKVMSKTPEWYIL